MYKIIDNTLKLLTFLIYFDIIRVHTLVRVIINIGLFISSNEFFKGKKWKK